MLRRLGAWRTMLLSDAIRAPLMLAIPAAALGRDRLVRPDPRARVPARRARRAVLRGPEGDRPGAAGRGRGARRPRERALPGRDAPHDAARPRARRDPDRDRLGTLGARRRRGHLRRLGGDPPDARPATRAAAADGRGRRRTPRAAVPRSRAAPAAVDPALRARRHGLDGVLRQRARAASSPASTPTRGSRAGSWPRSGSARSQATPSPTSSCSSASGA